MNDAQRPWWNQARSDHDSFVRLGHDGVHECHLLHYLQMATEKLSKACLCRSGRAATCTSFLDHNLSGHSHRNASMLGVREDLIIALEKIEPGLLLETWRWLIPLDWQPLFATALGDLFLKNCEGQIFWLDTGIAEIRMVAENWLEFEQAVNVVENKSNWFGEILIDALRDSGEVLKPGECYSYWTLPILGGKYEIKNFRIYDLIRHFSVHGPIHEKIRDLPDGTRIQFDVDAVD